MSTKFPSTFTTKDNLKLKCSASVPLNAKAILIAVHGLGDHSQSIAFRSLEKFFVDTEIALVRFDLRGHGESDGDRQHLLYWSDLREDLDVLIDLVRRELSGPPIFLLGASLGGLIALDYSMQRSGSVAGVIALAPALSAAGASRVVRTIVPILSRLLPKMSIDPGLDMKNISRDQATARSYTSDPLFSTKVTFRTAREILRAVSEIQANAAKLRTPLLILHGDGDVIVAAASGEDFFKRVSSADKHRIVYPGALHNLLLETNREEVHSDILDWLNGRL